MCPSLLVVLPLKIRELLKCFVCVNSRKRERAHSILIRSLLLPYWMSRKVNSKWLPFILKPQQILSALNAYSKLCTKGDKIIASSNARRLLCWLRARETNETSGCLAVAWISFFIFGLTLIDLFVVFAQNMFVPNVKVTLFFVWDLPTLIKNSAVVGYLKRMDALLQ